MLLYLMSGVIHGLLAIVVSNHSWPMNAFFFRFIFDHLYGVPKSILPWFIDSQIRLRDTVEG